MSRRYEFLDDDMAEIIEGPDLLEVFEEGSFSQDDVDRDAVALVIGNPWDAAGVLWGSRDGIAATLHRLLALVEGT